MNFSTDNLLKSFFKRIILVMLLTMAIGSVGIYFYQNYTFANSLAKEIKSVVDYKLSKYEGDVKNIDKQTLQEDVKDFMRKLGFLSVEIYDKDKNEIYSLQAKGERFKNKLQLLKDHDEFLIHTFPKNKELKYSFFELERENYFIHLFHPIIKNDKTIGYIEAITLIDPLMVNRFKRGIIATIITIIITVIIFFGAIFPIIYFAYKKLEQKRMELLESNIMTLNTLGNAIALRDSDTNEHNYRVTIYAILLARKLNLGNDDIKKLVKGAFLHDVGKIGIEDRILLKNGKLDEEEFGIMKQHVIKGVELVNGNSWLKDSIDVIIHHHEKFDGTGYPNKVKGDDIPLVARIFSIVDVFDALTSKRPYKEPFSYEKSIQILKESSGTHFDPEILRNFFEVSEDFYTNIRGQDQKELKELLGKLTRDHFLLQ